MTTDWKPPTARRRYLTDGRLLLWWERDDGTTEGFRVQRDMVLGGVVPIGDDEGRRLLELG